MSRREERKLGKAERQARRQHRETKGLDQIVKNAAGTFCSVSLAVLSWLILAEPVLAEDAGPPNWVDHTGYGGIAPLQNEGVLLRSGIVALSFVNDLQNGQYYRAASTYVLENSGPERTVAFGVPMEFYFQDSPALGAAGKRPSQEALDRMAKRISIEFEGRAVACHPRFDEAVGPGRYAHTGGGTVLGTCVVDLRLPSRKRLSLKVKTTAFVRLFGSSSAQLGYWLAPSGNWAGPTDRLQITAEVGGYAPIANVVSPPGARVAASTLSWDLRDIRVGRSDAVKIQFPPGWDEFGEGYGWVRTRAEVEVKVEGSRLDQLADGDAATRWCGAAPISFEARIVGYEARRGEHCAVRGVAFSTEWQDGSHMDPRTPLITSVRLSSCEVAADGIDIALARDRWPYFRETGEGGRIGDIVLPAGKLVGPPGCVRLEVRGLDPRAGGRFCIGELVPRVSCRNENSKRPSLKEVQKREFAKAAELARRARD